MLYSIFDPFSLEQEGSEGGGFESREFFYLVSTLSMCFVADILNKRTLGMAKNSPMNGKKAVLLEGRAPSFFNVDPLFQ